MMPPNMNSSLPTVGLIGLGAMGGGMAASLRRAGFTPHVFDVRAEVAQAFWNCPCVPMRERKECHCMLFLTEDNPFRGEKQTITLEEVKAHCAG